ncbi:hypothetical protein ACQ4PT_061582 [Festuca glaucescens]
MAVVVLAMAVVDTAMLGELMFRGDVTIREVPVAVLDTEQAVVTKRGGNFSNNNNRFGYGGNQQRWNTGQGGGYVNRPRAHGTEVAARNSIDADLLQQTVQAVVAAVTAATKISEPPAVQVPQAAAVADDTGAATGQQVGLPVAAPNSTVQQPTVTCQGIQDIQGAIAKGKDNEGQGPLKKKKKEDKAGCFRCKKPGHYIDDCPTPFCDICESIHHATPACYLLNAPKPTTTIHGYANEALMFFELPCGAFKAKAENPKLAKVTVDGDAMTIPEIIEQLKKIVPSEKFNWEVFHFRDNVFRVKLPSKQEVQRLKNFGTYICTDRESCLTFDLWSSLEKPLYMLPEVWVRVSVEIAQQSQEVNMMDANNGNDGNDGAHHGEGNNGGGHAMDMDNKGNDMDATSNNNEQDASNMNNGVDGMQEQLCNLDAIQIGTMHVKLTPTGIPSYAKNFNKNELFYKSLSHAEILPLKDKSCTDFGADPWPRGSSSGSSPVGAWDLGLQAATGQQVASGQQLPHAANGEQRMHADRQQQQRLPTSSRALSPAASTRVGVSCTDTAGHPVSATCRRDADGGSSAAGEHLSAACASSAPQRIQMSGAGGPGLGTVASGNHLPMIGTAAPGVAVDVSLEGSAVHGFSVGNGMSTVPKNNNVAGMGNVEHCISDFTSNLLHDEGDSYGAGSVLQPKLVSSLEQTKGGTADKVLMTTRGGGGGAY